MSDPDVVASRPVDRFTARIVILFATFFLLSALGLSIRDIGDDRFPWLGLFLIALAVVSLIRGRRKLV